MSLNKFSNVNTGLKTNLNIGCNELKCTDLLLSGNSDGSYTTLNPISKGNTGDYLTTDGFGNISFINNNNVNNGNLYSEYRTDTIIGDGTPKDLLGVGDILGTNIINANTLQIMDNYYVTHMGTISYTGGESVEFNLSSNNLNLCTLLFNLQNATETNNVFYLKYKFSVNSIGVNNTSLTFSASFVYYDSLFRIHSQNETLILGSGAIESVINNTLNTNFTSSATVSLLSAHSNINKFI